MKKVECGNKRLRLFRRWAFSFLSRVAFHDFAADDTFAHNCLRLAFTVTYFTTSLYRMGVDATHVSTVYEERQ